MGDGLNGYDYEEAFSRNLGFVTREQQQTLQSARVAVAGLGGTGGAQTHALARMGIGGFSLADPDTFELVNFNRQSGATMPNIGRKKTAVASELIKAINPDADIRMFEDGIGPENISAFLDGVDVVVDSLDFYCFRERFLLYASARERGLWVLTAPPLGFGFTLLAFDPAGMTFERYFDFTPDMSERDLTVALIAGLAPVPFLMRYLDKDVVTIGGRRLPSVGAAPFMIAGAVAADVVGLLTGKGKPLAAPTLYQFDALLHRYSRKTYRFGMRSPLQRLKKVILKRKLPQ
ncbi:MAG: ThiF family adenylyltransferase [Thiohalocapsa sp.]|nr:ThiF family adenylyltransferase [Thiohalocapsa sp.]MCF7991245.1 ThiF family adenylyltransferase [Thiohalocapsa sp.]